MAACEKKRSGGAVSFLIAVLSVGLWQDGETLSRQLSVELNPGTSSPPPGGDLLHVRAVGDNDTLHYLWCSQGAPTLLLVHTNSSSSTVQVNWTQFLDRNQSGGLKVEPESSVLYSHALVFSRLMEYDDANDTADPASSELLPPYDLQDFSWSPLNGSSPTASLCGSAPSSANGSLCLQVSVFASDGRGHLWPRLLHTANSSQVEVWLDGMLPRATRSRFLLELQSVGGASPLSHVEVHRSIDDEFTPSIFQVSRWIPQNSSSVDLGFVQWKPVAYRRATHALEDATPCRHSAPLPQSGQEVAAASGLIRAFYENPQTFGLNVTFGLAGEPFYNSTRFLSWTLLLGSGSAPVDSFSPLVLSMMAFGLGAPMILLLLGGVCVFFRKRPETTTYEPIN
ncbi:uncharacterized protein V6R79_016811 [Siganus canaliculatus]